jgi:hypothetical protein
MAKKAKAADDKVALRDFIAKARHLTTLSYTEQLNKPISASMAWKDNVVETSRVGPDEEALQAFLLTLRLFCQDNEEISLRNMANRVSRLTLASDLKQEFLDRRDTLNAYLDHTHGPPSFQIGSSKPVTNRQIFEAFTYGKYAHLTQAATVEGWERLVMHDGLRAGYDRVLRRMLQDIVSMAKYADDILTELSK